MIPLFVCHANCSRSMIAAYLFRDIAGAPALSAGLEVGDRPAARAVEMLAHWGVDAGSHRPRQIDRAVCDQAGAIFVMAAPYLRRLLIEYGEDLAVKSYLFADPFTRPVCFAHINETLRGRGRPMGPAAAYLDLLAGVDPKDH